MILVADSGSTKTTWTEVESGDKIVTEGLNPYFSSDAQLLAVCKGVRKHFRPAAHRLQLFFYGAGCGNVSQKRRMSVLLQQGFESEDVVVETDMLGACHAVSDGNPSLVGILGTGSNACMFDGLAISYQATSTGYILGDKGSANHVGRVLLNDYLRHYMPEALSHSFYDTYRMDATQFMDAVYHKPNPNRFLASLAPFAVSHLADDYCCQLIETTLREWWKDMLLPLCRQDGTLRLSVVGGYAKAIESVLRNVIEDLGVAVESVVADPAEKLTKYHRDSKNS